jgi:hypothetical protein
MVLVMVNNHVLHVCHALHVKRTIMKHSLVRNRRTVNVRRVCLAVMGILIFLVNAAVSVHLNVYLVRTVQPTNLLFLIANPLEQTVSVVIVLRIANNATTQVHVCNASRRLFCLAVLAFLFVLCCNSRMRRLYVSHVHPVVIGVSRLELINAPNAPKEFIFREDLALIRVRQIIFWIHLVRHVCPAVLAVPIRLYPRNAQALQTQSVTLLYSNALH